MRLRLVRRRNSDAFPRDDLDFTGTSELRHGFRLNDASYFRNKSRRIHPADFEDAKKHIEDLLARNIIRESHSPYASAIVLVHKNNKDLRLTVDYRTFNSRTVRDQYNIPNIEKTLHSVWGCLVLKPRLEVRVLPERDGRGRQRENSLLVPNWVL